jgi:competence protein ComEA
LAAIAGWWIAQGGLQGRLVEVERPAPQTASFQVDLNSAAWPELAQLPEVGPTLAKRIVASADGFFPDLASLDRVRGIGPAKLTRVRPYLIARPVAPASK